MKSIHIALISSAATLLSVMGSSAATISSAGTLADLTPAAFGTQPSDVADLDAAGVARDGFILFDAVPDGTNNNGVAWDVGLIDSSPAYITGLDGSGSLSSGGWAGYDYVTIDGTTHETGGITQPGVGAGTEVPLFTFDLNGSVPSSVTLGLIVNNSDGAGWGVSNVRVEGPGAISANQSNVHNGATAVIQFNINGGQAGETYTVYGTANSAGALIAGATFDSIPEPGSLALFGASGALLLRRRRRTTAA